MISLIMTTFNNKASINMVFSSISRNLTADDQLIIVDDHSTDGTWDILSEIFKKTYPFEFILIRNKKNQGLATSLNNAINYVTKTYIARHDADDLIIDGRFEHQIRLLKSNKKIDLLSSSKIALKDCDYIKVPSIGNNINIEMSKVSSYSLALRNLITHPAVICKSKVLKENAYDSNYTKAQDYKLWLQLISRGYNLFLDKTPVILYSEDLNYSKIKRQLILSVKARLTSFKLNQPFFNCFLLLGALIDFMRIIYRDFLYE